MNYFTKEQLKEIEEAFGSKEELQEFKDTKEDDLINYHHSLGRYFRNYYISKEKFKDYSNVDEVSFKMINELWRYLND